MLYLNPLNDDEELSAENLTLTSVVFEYDLKNLVGKEFQYLTLTSVVFECKTLATLVAISEFNFDKCCI